MSEQQTPISGGVEESRWRSLAKGISWRIVGTIDTIVIAAIITRNLKISITIGTIEVFTKVILYAIHERVWLRIKWGYKT